jgi:D-cysteine desulfhydrase
VADEVEQDHQHRRVYRVPFGGSSPASAEAYVRAGEELLEQIPDVQHGVVAVGSGGTMAGLVAALGPERVLGVDSGAVPDASRRPLRAPFRYDEVGDPVRGAH